MSLNKKKRRKKWKKKWSRNECSCKNSESVYACLRLSMWFMSMYFDYIAMIQSRIVLSIYVFCLSWQRREILSKSWWVASSISLFFFFFLHIDNKFKEGRCFNHNLLSFKILLYTLLEISLLIFFLLVYVFPFIK